MRLAQAIVLRDEAIRIALNQEFKDVAAGVKINASIDSARQNWEMLLEGIFGKDEARRVIEYIESAELPQRPEELTR